MTLLNTSDGTPRHNRLCGIPTPHSRDFAGRLRTSAPRLAATGTSLADARPGRWGKCVRERLGSRKRLPLRLSIFEGGPTLNRAVFVSALIAGLITSLAVADNPVTGTIEAVKVVVAKSGEET